MHSKIFQIENRKIGPDYPPLVIPELGINHNGSLETAFKMVLSAKKAGAEIVKHQTHIAEDEMSEEAKRIKPGNSNLSIFKIIKKFSLSEEEEFKLMRYTKKLSMIFLSTPFGRKAVDRLIKFGVKAFKIGSGEMNNYPLLDYVSKFKKPIILSTGMHEINNVKKVVQYMDKKRANFCLLHTTNLYPTPDHLIRLNSLIEMKSKFKNKIVGLSDHTSDNYSSFGAVALGANIIEKHFIDKKSRKGPDIPASIDEKQLKELIIGCKKIFLQTFGGKTKLKEEQVTRNFAFASVVSIKDIKKGEILTKDNIWVKRPGNGDYLAESYKKLLGKKIKSSIKANVQLKTKHLN